MQARQHVCSSHYCASTDRHSGSSTSPARPARTNMIRVRCSSFLGQRVTSPLTLPKVACHAPARRSHKPTTLGCKVPSSLQQLGGQPSELGPPHWPRPPRPYCSTGSSNKRYEERY